MKLKTLLLGAIASTAFAPFALADGHEGERQTGRESCGRRRDHGVRLKYV